MIIYFQLILSQILFTVITHTKLMIYFLSLREKDINKKLWRCVDQDGDMGGSWIPLFPLTHQMDTYAGSDYFWKKSTK